MSFPVKESKREGREKPQIYRKVCEEAERTLLPRDSLENSLLKQKVSSLIVSA